LIALTANINVKKTVPFNIAFKSGKKLISRNEILGVT
jgi:hypothetical protein